MNYAPVRGIEVAGMISSRIENVVMVSSHLYGRFLA